MPGKIEINKRYGIIVVQLYGMVLKEEIEQYAANALQIFNDTKSLSKILVDTTKQKNSTSTFTIFNHFSLFPRKFTLAVLAHESPDVKEEIPFFDTMGDNNFFQVKISHQKNQALRWLIEH